MGGESVTEPLPIKWLKFGVYLLIVLAICTALWLGPVSAIGSAMAKYVSDRGDSSSFWYDFPKWIQPNDAWHKWVGYPEKFSNVAGFITVGSIVSETLTNKSVKTCMLECAGKKEDCLGFQYDKSNTCTLFSGSCNIKFFTLFHYFLPNI
jgi:hypothetical protein